MSVMEPLKDKMDFSVFTQCHKELSATLKQTQIFKLEAVLVYALNQRSKATCQSILEVPMGELKDKKLLCSEDDILPALLASWKKLAM